MTAVSTLLYVGLIATAIDKTANLVEKMKTSMRRHDEVTICANDATFIARIGSQDDNLPGVRIGV